MRVVSLAPSHTEIVFALGLQEQLVAVTSFCNFPEAAKNLRRLPGWSTIQTADVLALKPDLVLTSSICQQGLKEALLAEGVNIHHADPRTLEGVAQSFVDISLLFGRGAEGLALSTKFKAELEALKGEASPERIRVYIEEWDKPPMAAGNWVPEMILAAGAEPFNRSLGEISREVTWEEVMEFDPQQVIYSICGVGLHFDPAAFLKVEGWNTLSAARARRICSVDDSYFNVPGPRLIEGIRLLKGILKGDTRDIRCA